jgi:uncharacterized repeat protein (TIGR01451 family)
MATDTDTDTHKKLNRLCVFLALLLGSCLFLLTLPGEGSALFPELSTSSVPSAGAIQRATPPPTPSPPEVPPIPPDVLHKIEPALLKQLDQLKEDGKVTFLVHLKEKAPLETIPLTGLSVQARRQAVVTALQSTAKSSQAGLRAYLSQQETRGRVVSHTPYWVFNGLAVTGDRETLFDLAMRPEVELIRADHKRYLEDERSGVEHSGSAFIPYPLTPASSPVEWNIARIRADLVWNALGIDGSGVVVANMDSGVDWQHPALLTKYRGYSPGGLHVHPGNWFCATDEGYTYPGDGHGHGTHTMGTIVGDGGIGVAPGARWIAAKIFHNQGYAFDSWIHAGFQWLLDPDGDPATDDAPDVVNNSWGSDDGSDQTFLPDVQALRAANILPVFSSGNAGPYGGTVGSPASFSESFAVGATDTGDVIASFSSRGPSLWGEIKPDVSAPGTNVRSSVPGGGYAEKQGTSMAAPHVTGLAALLFQAQPGLSLSAAEQAMTSNAVPLGSPIPNNDYGWGRIDAYNAVLSVGSAGVLSGVVRDMASGTPISGAKVTAFNHGTGLSAQAMTAAGGSYALGLAPGQYDATAEAFGYVPLTAWAIDIMTATTTTRDFGLTAKPTGTLAGQVTEEGTGAPLEASVTVLNTPVTVTTDPATGFYTTPLPVGTYALKASSPGHKVGYASAVTITEASTVTQDFVLSTAPTILLVDSGRWYYHSQIGYFQEALEALDYYYDIWTIEEPFGTPGDVPQASDLVPYDVVIWSAPEDSPGYVGAEAAITEYLDGGGKLFLTGQDVAYWDGGGSLFLSTEYFEGYLKAQYVADSADIYHLQGVAGDIFTGLDLTIQGEGGAGNQFSPDGITVADADYASTVVHYQDDGSSGQRVGLCLPYRVIYLSFGFEAINSASDRQAVMERAVNWLVSPRQQVGLQLTPSSQTLIGPPSTAVTHTLRLRNSGEIGGSDTYTLSFHGNDWPTALSTGTAVVASCSSVNVEVTVQVPPTAAWNVSDTVTVTARSILSPTLARSALLTTKTPAPILLVDDDRWYDQEAHYQAALEANGLPYDYWNVNSAGWPYNSPPLEILQRYPIVIWFNGYDWYQTLTPVEEARLATYLEGGGRLFLSGQDYLYDSGFTPFATDYLGVLDYSEDLTTTVAVGEADNLVGDGLGPYGLNYPFKNWSDALTPAVSTETAFRGGHGAPIGLAHAAPSYRTVFFGYPFETLDGEAAERVMERVVGWLSWLGTSTLVADRTVVAYGSPLTYTVTLRNDGWDDISQASLLNPIPAHTSYVAGSLEPSEAIYHPLTNAVTWNGGIASGQSVIVSYCVNITPLLDPGTVISNVAYVGYDDHSILFDREVDVRLDAPDLTASTITVDKGTAERGEPLAYTMVLRNEGVRDASSAVLTNVIPAHVVYIPGSLSTEGTPPAVCDGEKVTWSGSLGLGPPVTITYGVVVSTTRGGLTIRNVMHLEDDFDYVVERTATTIVSPLQQFLPLIMKNYVRNYRP